MNERGAASEKTAWDMSLTRELVEKKHGADQLQILRPVLRAVSTRLLHARIHRQDYIRLVHTHFEEPIQQGVPWWEMMWMDAEKDYGANNYFFVASEGYVYACIQALHAISDNLAHVTYYVLGWNHEGKPPLHKVSMTTVLDRLPSRTHNSPECAAILEAFQALDASPEYQALADATNHLKHHGGLPVRVGWGQEEDVPYTVHLGSFMRNGEHHPQREVSEYLETTFEVMSRATVAIGCALNNWLLKNP